MFRALALRQSDWRNFGLYMGLYAENGASYWWEYGDDKTRINQLNEKCSLIPWGFRVPIQKIIFVTVFCGSPNCLDVRKGRKLPCAGQNDQGDLSVQRLVWMCPCHFFLRREGVLGISHLVVSLFHQCLTFCNKCKLCSECSGRGARKIIRDLNGSLGSRYFLALPYE